jgi:hypothetical protein
VRFSTAKRWEVADRDVGEGNASGALRTGGDWIARCQGFGVVSPDGRIGTVEEVRYGPSRRWDSPTELAVQAGRGGRRRLIVPVDEIEAVVPEDRVVMLRSSPRVFSTEPEAEAEFG